MLSQTIIINALASHALSQSATASGTGLAGLTTTTGPSRETGRLPALGYVCELQCIILTPVNHLKGGTRGTHTAAVSIDGKIRIRLTHVAIDIDEEKILFAAQDIVSLGLKGVGYEYVNIDVSSSK